LSDLAEILDVNLRTNQQGYVFACVRIVIELLLLWMQAHWQTCLPWKCSLCMPRWLFLLTSCCRSRVSSAFLHWMLADRKYVAAFRCWL